VTDIFVVGKNSESRVMEIAAIAEKNSEHPIAEAIVKWYKEKAEKLPEADSFIAVPGKGVRARYSGRQIFVGNLDFVKESGNDDKNYEDIEKILGKLESAGKTAVVVSYDRKIIGVIGVADTLKKYSSQAVAALKNSGKEVVMITGDNMITAQAIAKQVGITQVMAKVLPENKADKVKELQKQGKVVAMVGDGINDSVALAQADAGIAIGSGTDIAKETGNIILIKDDLRDVVTAIDISRFTMSKIRQNLFWAFFYNAAGIPIAAGALYAYGIFLNPMIAAAAMAFSSVSVVGNALLMRFYKPKAMK
jgi:Cu+-exporting ATPase